MKLAVLFGSSSNEHEVSVVSAASIIKNLDKNKYLITPIYLGKDNTFYIWNENVKNIKPNNIGILPTNLKKINNAFQYLKNFDLVFIMIHGKNGEDGILSAIFDFLGINYIANKTNSSVITMDKILTKIILEKNNIKTSPFIYFTKYNNEYIYKDESINYDALKNIINSKFKYPIFVKPANSGSSIGITKVKDKHELDDAINEALKIDNKVLIEEMIVGRELECGILEQRGEIKASSIGEVLSAEDFYNYSAKYTNKESNTIIPCKIKKETENIIKKNAIQIFKILNCHGYSRCDFFVTKNDEVIFNEINTIPGFTEISMYPKLFESNGIKYSKLLDIIIEEKTRK